MGRVKFSDVFSVEYLDIVAKYRDKIQELLSTYDIIIFMARKAICFYKAMAANGEIISTGTCEVLSSRVLSYNVLNQFVGKKIAIVDDVVVRGKSISYARQIFKEYGIDIDIYFVACEKEFIDGVDFKDKIKSSYIYLSDINIYQLSGYITEYIEASMIPYNIDQPIYRIKFDSMEDCENAFLNRNHVSNITDGLQKEYGIRNMSVHFDPDILKKLFGDDFVIDSAYLKIRFLFYAGSRELVAVPFVLLPEISYEKLDEVFHRLFGNGLDEYIHHRNISEEYENKLKMLQYVLSHLLFIHYARTITAGTIEKDLENEHMQYAAEILKDSYIVSQHDIFLDWSYSDQVKSIDSYFMLDSFLSDTYDYIFDPGTLNEYYYDARGCRQEQRIITFAGLSAYIKRAEYHYEKYFISSIIDIFIDKGILVPSIVHGERKSIVRGYKCGEIYNLTKKGIDLFAYMLEQYAKLKEGKALDKVEFEKLCVLFFKKAAYQRNLFTVSKTYDGDCFSICYSKFGPRVSDSNKKYKVESKSALAAVLDDEGKISLNSLGKYSIEAIRAPQDKKWEIIAQNFALLYFHLYKCFENKDFRNRYVHTYNEFLTLLAIGPDRKNQMFSLMAELNLMTRIETTGSLPEILEAMDHYAVSKQNSGKGRYQGIMDGIGSGMWKYSCYCQDNLMDTLFANVGKIHSDVRYIMEDYLTAKDENDENPNYVVLINECGYLIYEIAYLFNYAQKRYTGNEMNNIFMKAAFYNRDFENMRREIEKKCETYSERELVLAFGVLKKRALALVNQCDLCIESAAISSIITCQDIWVLFHPEKNLQECGDEINLHTNIENDFIRKCIFLPLESNKNFEQQLGELIKRYDVLEKKALLLFVDIENPYEGVFKSCYTATGDYFKNLVRQIILKSNYDPKISPNRVILCTRKGKKNENIHIQNFVLKLDCCGEVSDGYQYLQYILIKEEAAVMGKSNGASANIFNGAVTFNGPVGAVGEGNDVNQQVNLERDAENFYRDIEKINAETLHENACAVTLVKEIKEEAARKNKDGALAKLKNLAVCVGKSTFLNLVSAVIVDAMKSGGWFPF